MSKICYASRPLLILSSTQGADLTQNMSLIFSSRPHVLPFDETFNNLSQLSASILAALAWTLGVHTTHFAALLDDTPLRPGDTSASMLSYFSYKERARKKGNAKPAHSACPAHIDKGLVTIVVSDDPKLEVSQNLHFCCFFSCRVTPVDKIDEAMIKAVED